MCFPGIFRGRRVGAGGWAFRESSGAHRESRTRQADGQRAVDWDSFLAAQMPPKAQDGRTTGPWRNEALT